MRITDSENINVYLKYDDGKNIVIVITDTYITDGKCETLDVMMLSNRKDICVENVINVKIKYPQNRNTISRDLTDVLNKYDTYSLAVNYYCGIPLPNANVSECIIIQKRHDFLCALKKYIMWHIQTTHISDVIAESEIFYYNIS